MGERKSMDDIMSLCKRRGFVYQASEIYGGINGFWDYGPLGSLLKKNLRDAWWQDMIMNPCWGRKGPDGDAVRCVSVETCIIQHPRVWEASGHLAGFADPMRKCAKCGHFVRADQYWEILATGSEWFASLIQEFDPAPEGTQTPGIDSARLMKWARGKGKKLAPNLALVRNPEVTLSWLATRVNGQPDAPPDVQEIVRHIATEQLNATGLQEPCPRCGGELGEPAPFKLMFETWAGLTQSDDNKVYLRPETAQGIFVQFKNVVDTTRVKVPFGIGNTGKSFRNEITPRNFTFRSREFEQAELEFFCHPDASQDWYRFWRDFRMEWWQSIGLEGENLILREHDADELSHYSTGTSDVEYRFPFTSPGFGELEGIAHRGCFDLTQHQQHSGVKLDYFDTERGETLPNGSKKGERYIPHVIEPAAGLDRGALALMCEAYTKDETRPSPEIMKFHPRMAPIKAAVFPLVNKDGMPEVAEKLTADLRKRFGHLGLIETDPKQSIGKRYARMDEAGCPFCFTIDGDTLTGQTVTVRDRDTGAQDRIAIEKVVGFVAEKLGL
ncbi:MAG: glycine--tRNA ligase [Phycisphaerales bacterium]|jgi:glycyl-tRNA synthetase|nr:glycine--tRNA ligase [Phycisphaerales bacterium]